MENLIREKLAVFFESDLPNMATHCEQKSCGFSIYRGVLIQWDEDKDTRILDFIDDMDDYDRENLLIAQEHEGVIQLRWKGFVPDEYKEGGDIQTRSGDVWSIHESVGIEHA